MECDRYKKHYSIARFRKEKKDLSNKIDNLKEALSKERKQRKKMNETHICKLYSYTP